MLGLNHLPPDAVGLVEATGRLILSQAPISQPPGACSIPTSHTFRQEHSLQLAHDDHPTWCHAGLSLVYCTGPTYRPLAADAQHAHVEPNN